MDLHSNVSDIPGVGSIVKKRLEKLQINTVEDLLYHIPFRYEDFRKVVTAKNARVGDMITLHGSIKNTANIYTKKGRKMFIAEVEDQTGTIKCAWFSQPYLFSVIKKGHFYSFSGKVEWLGKEKALITPMFEETINPEDISQTGSIIPIYPETRGLTSKWFRSKVNLLIQNYDNLGREFLPDTIISRLPKQIEALKNIHIPKNPEGVEPARQRLGFNELLKLFLQNNKRKENWKSHKVTKHLEIQSKLLSDFKKHLPFEFTNSQNIVTDEILSDLSQKVPMNRLLEGDVGSGKTAVAAAACYAVFANGYQSVIMAPTQILASQHYKTLNEIFKNLNVRISLLTGHEKKVAIGKSDIFVGTHALLHTKINFSDVALVVIDEQHRFGVEQRTHLIKSSGKRNAIPHILTMTATPIPRTIAMSLYGDLDLSVLTEMPKGRIPVTTWIVPPEKRSGGYDWIKDKIEKEKTQVYIICPLIEESESDLLKEVKSAKLEYENIKKIFPQFRIGLLHGKLKPKDKDSAINEFKEGKIDILVSTAVVEVGIDVANAGIIVIEAAERFGLAQLHQLRGRVGRGNTKSYCLLFTQSRSDKTVSRLKVLKENHSGFTLAEMDLKMRGPGEVFGTMQSGFSNLKVARWSDIELIKKAKQVAEKIQLSPELYIQVLDYYFGSDSPLN